MSFSLDQILPSLQALGVTGYWLIGLAALLEASLLTGGIIPGTLIVDAGGILVQRGILDFFDLVWFVAIGSALGSGLSFWFGQLIVSRKASQRRIGNSAALARATRLFERRGGMALVIGRFLGPLAGLVPLAAGMAGMDRRRFLIWNIAGSVPYALAHVGFGYFLGNVMGRLGGSLTRVAIAAGIALLMLALIWGILYSALRLLPLAWDFLAAALQALGETPAIARRIEAHPQTAHWLAARLARGAFTGLPLTVLVVIFAYLGVVWLEFLFDFHTGNPLQQLDLRLAELFHHIQAPVPIRIAAFVTAAGGWQVVVPLVTAALIWLTLQGQRALAAGLAVAAIGNTLSVTLLKLAFGRPRPPLGVFVETSGSFPSGHAAASVAVYGMLGYALWRVGRLRAETALLLAGLVGFAIGFSRLYLVEHYLSDVLSGWLVGALWVSLALMATFALWYLTEGTLSIHEVFTARREAFYWLAVLFTFALGTAVGDLISKSVGVGFAGTGVLFGLIIASLALGYFALGLDGMWAFWLCYIFTRPLGASFGDFLAQPAEFGGLGLGTTITSLIFLAIIGGTVLVMSRKTGAERLR